MSGRNTYNVAPIPGDNSGGGDNPSADGGVPVGTVVPFAGTTTPQKWLLCNGSEYRQDNAEDLYGVIGYSYGVNPSVTSMIQGSGGAIYGYNTALNTINIVGTNIVNTFIKVGTYIKLSGATATTGGNINGTIVLITTSNVAINGTGTTGIQYSGTFVQPIGGNDGGGMITTFNRFSVPVPDLRLASPIGAQTGTINLGTSGGASTVMLAANNLAPHSHTLWRPGAQANQGATNADWIGSPNVDTGLAGGGNIYRATDTPATGSRTQVVGQDGTGQVAVNIRNPYVALNYIIKAET